MGGFLYVQYISKGTCIKGRNFLKGWDSSLFLNVSKAWCSESFSNFYHDPLCLNCLGNSQKLILHINLIWAECHHKT